MNASHKLYPIFILFFSLLTFATTPTDCSDASVILNLRHQSYDRNFKEHRPYQDFSCNNTDTNRSSPNHYQFKKFTANDFKEYCHRQRYTENQILHQRCLYMFDEFVKYAQTYSAYKCTIQQLHTELKKLNIIQKAWHITQGTYCKGLEKRIYYLYNQLNSLKTPHYAHENIPYISVDQLKKQNIVGTKNSHNASAFHEQLSEYNILDSTYRAHIPSLSKAIDKRIEAYKSMNNSDAAHYVSQSYNLNNNITHLLYQYGHDITSFTECFGTQLDQAIHHESLDILNRIGCLSPNSILYDHQEALVDFAVTIVDYNHEGLTNQATHIADLCWTLLDYGQAVLEGAALGIYSATTDIVNNPIEATVCMIAGKQVLAYQLSKVLYNVADIGITAIHDIDHAKNKWCKYTEPLNNIIDAINKKEITVRDAIKGGTTFTVGLIIQSKLLGGLSKFYNTIKQKSFNFIQKNPLLKPKKYFTTPEGLLFKATSQADTLKQSGLATSNLKNSVEKPSKINTVIIPEFIQQNRIPLDRETILHSIDFKKTKIIPVKGAQVYTKDNLFYHRDTLHKGKGSHLEVYNKQGIHLGEADPITGQLIKHTADKNKKLNL